MGTCLPREPAAPSEVRVNRSWARVRLMGALKIGTPADLLDLPDHVVGELVNGEVHVSPRPASRHALAAASLGMDIGGPFQRGRGGPGGWWILTEPELHLGGDVVVPDLAGWRRERMPQVPDVAAFTLAPDWVCEVLSKRTARFDRVEKMMVWAREGVGHVWLVDPVLRVLEVYRLSGPYFTLLGAWADQAIVSAPPFEVVPLELSALWLESGASPSTD